MNEKPPLDFRNYRPAFFVEKENAEIALDTGMRTTHVADLFDAAQVERFRDEVANRHDTDRVHLLFNNAGISGGGSMIAHIREEWERTLNIC